MISLHLKTKEANRAVYEYDIVFDDKIVGMCQLRQIPTKSINMPEGFENHVYYEIKPEFRGRGYATKALYLLQEKARELGVNELIITVHEDNLPSRRVIEKNGGILVHKKEGRNIGIYCKYRIET